MEAEVPLDYLTRLHRGYKTFIDDISKRICIFAHPP